jgi:hypothetical protein
VYFLSLFLFAVFNALSEKIAHILIAFLMALCESRIQLRSCGLSVATHVTANQLLNVPLRFYTLGCYDWHHSLINELIIL